MAEVKPITEFLGEHAFLSNFADSPIIYKGIIYPTAEHAFQASKTLDKKERRRIAALPSPALAKREGRKLELREDWEDVKLQVMEDILRRKFLIHPELTSMTDAELGEIQWYSHWRQYAFFPHNDSIFNHECFDVIAIVLRSLNEKQKVNRNAGR